MKDAIHEAVVRSNDDAVNPAFVGTKAAARYSLMLGPGESTRVHLRLTAVDYEAAGGKPFGKSFDRIFSDRIREVDELYATVVPEDLSDDAKSVMRQALAGMLWSKQYYHDVVKQWLEGDPEFPEPSGERRKGRNRESFFFPAGPSRGQNRYHS